MKKIIILALIILIGKTNAQNRLDYYINKAIENSPALKEYLSNEKIAGLQGQISVNQINSPQIYLSANYLFAPYFNNGGKIISTSPDPMAIGYDIGLSNGGQYSAKINIDKNLFNSSVIKAYEEQTKVNSETYKNNFFVEKHALEKEITNQFLAALIIQQECDLTGDIIRNLEKEYLLLEKLASSGLARQQELLLLRIEIKNQKINLEQNLSAYNTEILQLNSLSGIRDTMLVRLDTVSLSIKTVKGNDMFLRKFYLDSLSVSLQQNIYESKYLPQLKAYFNAGLDAVEIRNMQRKLGFSAGIDFTYPLFDGGQKSITRQQSEIAKNSISNYKLFTINDINIKKKNFELRCESFKKNISMLNDQIGDYDKLISLSVLQLEKGNISMIDYLTLLKNFIDIKKNKLTMENNLQSEINNYNYWNWSDEK